MVASARALTPTLTQLLTDIQNASGQASAKALQKQLRNGIRANADNASIKGFKFDRTNPKAMQWVKDHALETIDSISQTTRDQIEALIETSFEGEIDVHDLADKIDVLIGDEARAETIARTETMDASNEGQQEAWDQAVEEGLLKGDENQVWIISNDERLCPICASLEDQLAPLGEIFTSDEGDEFDGPPAHPRCRCTLGLEI